MRLKLPFLSPLKQELDFRRKDWSKDSLESESMSKQWRSILAASSPEDVKPASNPRQHILFVTGYGLSPAMLSCESVLMMALHLRGCRVSSLYCNSTLPSCEFNATGSNRPDAGRHKPGLSKKAILNTCSTCVANIHRTFSDLPVSLHGYQAFLEPEDWEAARSASEVPTFENFRDFQYNGIKVGQEAFSSVLRVTLRGTIEDSATNRWLVRRYLHSCVLMAIAARRAYQALQPDRIVATHGVYTTHGIATMVANRMGIPIVIHGFSYRKNTIWLSHNDTYHRTLVTEPTSMWVDHKLSSEEREQTWNYLLSRQAGGRDYVTYHPNPIEDMEILCQELKIDRSREIISLFTNVIWDAQIYYDFNVFTNIFEWVRTTIEEAGKNEKIWLVIRVHPAEVKGGMPTKQPILPEIMKMFPSLPENVRIIPPESDLSSYTLANHSRAALIYGTKMGLEMAARGLNVIVCGETFNRGKGFTIDIESRDQYISILRDIDRIESLDPAMRELALQYSHYLFFRKMIDFPFTQIDDIPGSKGIRFTIRNLDALKDGASRHLDTICEGIMESKPLFMSLDANPLMAADDLRA